jgi:hypothetical protein
MKSNTLLLTLIWLATPLVAQLRAPLSDAEFLAKFETTFEPGGEVAAKAFVPPDLMSGRLHSVSESAYNDGLRNTYFLSAGYGQYEITGTPALLRRIREIYALDYLRGVSKSEEFGKAIANAGKEKVDSAVRIVKDPFGTIKRVPMGASRFFGRIGESMKGGRSESEDRGLAGITGVSKAKAQLAAKLGVSPYTTNEELQQELTNVARASAGGGLVVGAATAAVGGGAGSVLSVIGVNQALQDTLVNSTPEDLRIINRKKLLALGVNRALTDEFLMHPWFSPWHETITTDALSRIGANPTAFLTNAVMSLTEEDAFFFQRIAQILARYHSDAVPLRTIRFEHHAITAIDRNGTLVVPVSLDYATWCERTARRTEEFTALAREGGDIKGLALWTDGRLSERLREEFRARNIAIRERALDAGSH